MEDAPLTVRCTGHAGQSFGVWNAGGLHLYLEGDANDYVGKGLSGGKIAVFPPKHAHFIADGRGWTGKLWAVGSKANPVRDREHHRNVFFYILRHAEEGAWIWDFREHQPPMLIAWGKNDQIFPAAGAEPYRRDLKTLEFHLLDAGHFALESNGDEIAALMRNFLAKQVRKK